MKRAGIQKIFNLAKERKINAVFMIHGDRLSRNTFDHIEAMNFFEKTEGYLSPLVKRKKSFGETRFSSSVNSLNSLRIDFVIGSL